MKGSAVSSEDSKGEFSLIALLLRLAMLATVVALVYVGYCHENRRHKNKK